MSVVTGVDEDGTVIRIEADALVKALTIITTPHHMIHEGKGFIASNYFADVADATNALLRILVGANKELHATLSVAVQGNGDLKISEGTTYTNNGTAVTIYDKNRTTGNASDALCYHTPTIDAFGPTIFRSHVPGGTKQRALGSVRTNGEEWILKKSTDYLFRFTNRGGDDMDISIELEFYEV